MTIGTNIMVSLIIWAVPLRTGLKDLVVPCGKVITHPSFKAI
jgi:hypothetical protein